MTQMNKPDAEAIALLPCPFCGHPKARCLETTHEALVQAGFAADLWNVVCDVHDGGCGGSSGCGNKTPQKAITAWNRRTAPPPSPVPADTRRLDWLEKSYMAVDVQECRESAHFGILGVTFDKPSPTLRQAIDAAMGLTDDRSTVNPTE